MLLAFVPHLEDRCFWAFIKWDNACKVPCPVLRTYSLWSWLSSWPDDTAVGSWKDSENASPCLKPVSSSASDRPSGQLLTHCPRAKLTICKWRGRNAYPWEWLGRMEIIWDDPQSQTSSNTFGYKITFMQNKCHPIVTSYLLAWLLLLYPGIWNYQKMLTQRSYMRILSENRFISLGGNVITTLSSANASLPSSRHWQGWEWTSEAQFLSKHLSVCWLELQNNQQ